MPDDIFYADSSVLVKRHVNEIGSGWLRSLVTPAQNNSMITATLSIVEVISALNRRVRESSIATNDYRTVAGDFVVVSNNEYRLIDLTQSVLTEAQRLLEAHPLRAGDSIQLASAILSRDALMQIGLQEPIFLASDDGLLAAAIAEGFMTDNPLLH